MIHPEASRNTTDGGGAKGRRLVLTIGEDCGEALGDEEAVVPGLVVVRVDARDLDLDLDLLGAGFWDGLVVDELDWLSNLSHDEGFLCGRHAVCLYLCVIVWFGTCFCVCLN